MIEAYWQDLNQFSEGLVKRNRINNFMKIRRQGQRLTNDFAERHTPDRPVIFD